ncbi:MAG: tripartite tricarboxylate transporter TctB family protein [Oceanospirillaceae bacterium]
MDRRKADIVVMTILIIASIIILTNDNLTQGGAETDLGSLFLPRIVACFIIGFALFIAGSSVAKLLQKEPMATNEGISLSGFWGVNLYVAIFIGYWFLVPLVGFLLVTPFVMMAVAVLLGGRRWIAMTTVSIVVPAMVFYGSIHFLRVYLPTWSLS